jgi:acetyltransferase-like isoleucine patch superfamily enzyme
VIPPGVHVAAEVALSESVVFDVRSGGEVHIGKGARIDHGAVLAPFGGTIRVGARCYVGPYSVLYGHGGLTIGDDTLIAAHCVLIPANHKWDDAAVRIAYQGETRQGISVAPNVWLGTGVRVLDGVTIGEGVVVGAGAVVTRSIPAGSVVAGVPARVIARRGDNKDGAVKSSGAGGD